ncbi:MAG: T9SS type A sorting domain-containing protein, partial [Psychroserpens sp.]|nr:T9SS type A sorting domain-containing protein [Psychroserpens sp.]
PVFYDLEYSDDNQNSFNSIVTDLTSPSYLWSTTPLINGDEVIFRITSRSVDGVLSSTTLSPVATLATLSLTELDLGKLKSYPNPVTNVLTVNLETIRSGTYNIVDLKGSIISDSEFLDRDILEIETSVLQSGIYILNIQTDSGVFNLRFIKQ